MSDERDALMRRLICWADDHPSEDSPNDDIRELCAEVDRLQREQDMFMTRAEVIEAYEAKVERLQADAERYRFLRDNRVFAMPPDRDGPGYMKVSWDWSPYRGDPESLDAAIDAARKVDAR